ncbi:SDR family oxidoreductase [Ahrensia marina]|uniref:Short-chain dehydrogenase n=1 Tax=Ahrensia marina TaxID=1514904 RepID=A0A0M9GN68_9HYPH|nr:SDR family oxidoreductase [Ahrensia marina]KPB01723.1 short-chain dehydrogenase [Ahrensia marina]
MARVLITGVARGIGLALADELVKRGHEIVGTVRSDADAEAMKTKFGDNIHVLTFDVTDQKAILEAANRLEGSIDILVNNAGIIGPEKQSTLDMDFDGFAKTLQINTLAPLMVCQAFLPHLRKSTNPGILTISSQMGKMAYQVSDRIAYRASKSAVNKVMQGLATDLLASGIPVQLVHPGWVRTDMGGQGADISVEESASGIADLVENINIAKSGTFVAYDGSPMDW